MTIENVVTARSDLYAIDIIAGILKNNVPQDTDMLSFDNLNNIELSNHFQYEINARSFQFISEEDKQHPMEFLRNPKDNKKYGLITIFNAEEWLKDSSLEEILELTGNLLEEEGVFMLRPVPYYWGCNLNVEDLTSIVEKYNYKPLLLPSGQLLLKKVKKD
jgi:hypothetical protein